MKSFLAIVFFFLCSRSLVEGATCCEGPWWFLCKECYKACPLRSHPLKNSKSNLEANIFGQDDAVALVVNALGQFQRGKGPLVLHFAGDNGTGKTKMTEIIAESFFAFKDGSTDKPKGMLYFQGSSFTFTSRKQLEEYRLDIRKRIVAHLSLCQQAIIVFDEAELPDKELMLEIEAVASGNPIRWDEKVVSAKDAIIIICSDFGSEGVTSTMTTKELQNFIDSEMKEIWDNKRLNALVKQIVPFKPMEKIDTERTDNAPSAVVGLVNNLLGKLKNMEYLPELVKELGVHLHVQFKQEDVRVIAWRIYRDAISPDSPYKDRNYRGIQQMFDHLVLSDLTARIMAFVEKKPQGTDKSQRDGLVAILQTNGADDIEWLIAIK